jgi:subtilisin family serine protease
MRALALAGVLAALVLLGWISGPAVAETPAFDDDHHFVVVTFANEPYRPAARAGSNGRHYSGNGYGVAQGAHGAARRVASTYSLREVASWPIKELGVHCVVYQIPDSRSVADVVAVLSKDPRVTLAQPLQEFRTLTSEPPTSYNDPLYGLQTNLTSLGIPEAHEHSRGAGVKVGLIDTGVDSNHPDLRDRIVGTRSFVSSNSPTPAAAGSYRHGTAMAGLIAAVANNKLGIVGIAPLAQIEVFAACWQLKRDSDDATCNTFTLAQALAAALEARIPLINLSLAGPADPLLSALVESGLKRGVIFVGSASEDPHSFPTNIDGVIGVTNSESAAIGRAGLLSAPGTHVMTLRPGAEYDFESGTSVAAAEVTGLIALMLGADSHLTQPAIMALLKATDPAHPLNINDALAKIQSQKGTGRWALEVPGRTRKPDPTPPR